MENKFDENACAEVTMSLLKKSISDDYVIRIYNAIVDKVVMDVKECADPEEWNEDDVKLAIGRSLMYPITGEIV